jgi:hypothetical protein
MERMRERFASGVTNVEGPSERQHDPANVGGEDLTQLSPRGAVAACLPKEYGPNLKP